MVMAFTQNTSTIIIYILCITRSELLYFYWHWNIMSMYISHIDKNSGPFGIWTHHLCDTDAALYQLSWQANQELVIILVPNKPSKWCVNDCKYMKIIYMWTAIEETNMEAIHAVMNTAEVEVKNSYIPYIPYSFYGIWNKYKESTWPLKPSLRLSLNLSEILWLPNRLA